MLEGANPVSFVRLVPIPKEQRIVLAVFLNFQCLREVESVAEDDCFGSGINAQFFIAGYQLIDKIKLIAGIAAGIAYFAIITRLTKSQDLRELLAFIKERK